MATEQTKSVSWESGFTATLELDSNPTPAGTGLCWVATQGAFNSVLGLQQDGAEWKFVRTEATGKNTLELWAAQNIADGASKLIHIRTVNSGAGLAIYAGVADAATDGSAINVSGSAAGGLPFLRQFVDATSHGTTFPNLELEHPVLDGSTLLIHYIGYGAGGAGLLNYPYLVQQGVSYQGGHDYGALLNGDNWDVWRASNVSAAGKLLHPGSDPTDIAHRWGWLLEVRGCKASSPSVASAAVTNGANNIPTTGTATVPANGAMAVAGVLIGCNDGDVDIDYVKKTAGWNEISSNLQPVADTLVENKAYLFWKALATAEALALTFEKDLFGEWLQTTTEGAGSNTTPTKALTPTVANCLMLQCVLADLSTQVWYATGGYAVEETVTGDSAMFMSLVSKQATTIGVESSSNTLTTADSWSQLGVGIAPAAAVTNTRLAEATLETDHRTFWAGPGGRLSTYKDTDSVLDYIVDWSRLLNGDTLSSVTFAANGVTIGSSSNTTTTTTMFISGSGGTVTITAVTAASRTHILRLDFLAATPDLSGQGYPQ